MAEENKNGYVQTANEGQTTPPAEKSIDKSQKKAIEKQAKKQAKSDRKNAKKGSTRKKTAYGTELEFDYFRSNNKIRSKYLAGVLAIVFGVLGVHQFYMGHVVKGIIELAVTALCYLLFVFLFHYPVLMILPFAYAIIRGITIMNMSDEKFRLKNKARTF